MLIIGASGHAKELIGVIDAKNYDQLMFFDNVSSPLPIFPPISFTKLRAAIPPPVKWRYKAIAPAISKTGIINCATIKCMNVYNIL